MLLDINKLPFALAVRIDITPTCWDWTGRVDHHGYGIHATSKVYGKAVYGGAHRFVYECLVGPIPQGLVLDHLCKRPICVFPEHLEPVTQRTNLLRGDTVTSRKDAQTHCIRGHEFTPKNTYIKTNGCRSCRECHRTYRYRKAGLCF